MKSREGGMKIKGKGKKSRGRGGKKKPSFKRSTTNFLCGETCPITIRPWLKKIFFLYGN